MVADELDPVQLDRHATLTPLHRRRHRERLDVRPHVVDAEERRAAVERGDRRPDRAASTRPVCASGRPSPRPSVDLRERPTSTGRPSATIRSSRWSSWRFWSGGLAEADARIEADRVLVDARGRPRTEPLLEERRDLRDDVVVARARAASSRGSPCMCIRQRYAPASATTPASSGSPRSAVTSFTIVGAESESPPCDLGLRGVDRDRQRRARRLEHRDDAAQLLRPRETVRPRAASTRRRRRRSARLRRASARPAAAASSAEAYDPPSEKLSGVTLTTPITAGRGKRSSCGARLMAMDVSAPRRGGPAGVLSCSAAPRSCSSPRWRSRRPERLAGRRRSRRAARQKARTSRVSLFLVLMVIAAIVVPIMLSFFRKDSAEGRRAAEGGQGDRQASLRPPRSRRFWFARSRAARASGGSSDCSSPRLPARDVAAGHGTATSPVRPAGRRRHRGGWRRSPRGIVARRARARAARSGASDPSWREASPTSSQRHSTTCAPSATRARAVIANVRAARAGACRLRAARGARRGARRVRRAHPRRASSSGVPRAGLTALFARAKFSQHEVRPEMKDEAIETLEELQDELRAAEAEERAARSRRRAREAGVDSCDRLVGEALVCHRGVLAASFAPGRAELVVARLCSWSCSRRPRFRSGSARRDSADGGVRRSTPPSSPPDAARAACSRSSASSARSRSSTDRIRRPLPPAAGAPRDRLGRCSLRRGVELDRRPSAPRAARRGHVGARARGPRAALEIAPRAGPPRLDERTRRRPGAARVQLSELAARARHRPRRGRAGHRRQARAARARPARPARGRARPARGLPGLAKTLAAPLVRRPSPGSASRASSSRPTCCPRDVTGSSIWNQRDATFEFRPGPIFANVLLADEINRAPPKTQAALLEAMQERQVTIDGTTARARAAVPRPRDAEPDRVRGHLPAARGPARPLRAARRASAIPTADDEWEVLERRIDRAGRRGRAAPGRRPVDRCSRCSARSRTCTSTRASVATSSSSSGRPARARASRSARARADRSRCSSSRAAAPRSTGRDFVTPDDVKGVAVPALAHRLVLQPELWVQRLTAEDVVRDLLDDVPTPAAEGTGRPPGDALGRRRASAPTPPSRRRGSLRRSGSGAPSSPSSRRRSRCSSRSGSRDRRTGARPVARPRPGARARGRRARRDHRGARPRRGRPPRARPRAPARAGDRGGPEPGRAPARRRARSASFRFVSVAAAGPRRHRRPLPARAGSARARPLRGTDRPPPRRCEIYPTPRAAARHALARAHAGRDGERGRPSACGGPRVRRHPPVRPRRPPPLGQLARERPARQPRRQRAPPGAEHRRHRLPRQLRRGAGTPGRARSSMPCGSPATFASRFLAAPRPRRARHVRRRPALAEPGTGLAAVATGSSTRCSRPRSSSATRGRTST